MPYSQQTQTLIRRLTRSSSLAAIAATAPDHLGYSREVRATAVRQDWGLSNRQCAGVLLSVMLAVAVVAYTVVEVFS